ncbi:glycosyltransferase family 2 protein [Candidatus Sumerlaeota bacterium]|nr:glycosyltransferase family 2 protein [Candidatus Sumerlaeota bacterium]
MKNPLASIVILTWNSAEFIERCLEGLSWQTYPNYEIIVVDNASSDDTLSRAKNSPQAALVKKFIAHEKNLGCAGGNNTGWRASSGEIVIFLNPDIMADKYWLENLVSALESDPRAAIAGCKLYYPNSNIIQHAGGELHHNAMSEHYGSGEEDKGQYDDMRDVDYVTGAAIAVKREFLEETGGFDGDYFPAYYEETDLCFKAHKKGRGVLYIPRAVAYHFESAGLSRLSPRFYDMYYTMRMRFVFKNYSFWEILTRFLPFELRWMVCEKKAKGFRLMQFSAYWKGLKFRFFG